MAEFEIQEEEEEQSNVMQPFPPPSHPINHSDENEQEDAEYTMSFVLASMGIVVAASPSPAAGRETLLLHQMSNKDHKQKPNSGKEREEEEEERERGVKKAATIDSPFLFASVFIGILVAIPLLSCFVMLWSRGSSIIVTLGEGGDSNGEGGYDNRKHQQLLVNVSEAAAAMQLLVDTSPSSAEGNESTKSSASHFSSSSASVVQSMMTMIASWKTFEGWRNKKSPHSPPFQAAESVQLHVTYIMDAYLMTTVEKKGTCSSSSRGVYYYCRGNRRRSWCMKNAVKNNEAASEAAAPPPTPIPPVLLLHNDDDNNDPFFKRRGIISLHIMASVADPLWLPWKNPLAKFVGSQSSEDSEDWHMLEFWDALVQACRAVDAQQQRVNHHFAKTATTTVEDVFVPSRICSMVTAPSRTGATLRGVARLARLVEDSRDGILPLREYSNHLISSVAQTVLSTEKEVPHLYVLDETSDGGSTSMLPMFARDEGLLPALFFQEAAAAAIRIGIIVITNRGNARLLTMLMDICKRTGLQCAACPAGVCVAAEKETGSEKDESTKKNMCTCIFARDDAKVF